MLSAKTSRVQALVLLLEGWCTLLPPDVCRRLEAAVEDAISDKEKAQALVAAERAEVSLSICQVSLCGPNGVA